jgi:hypothetical protein
MPESDASRSEFKLIPSESTALGEVLPIPAPRYEPTTEMDYRKIRAASRPGTACPMTPRRSMPGRWRSMRPWWRAPITRLVGWSTQSRILASWTIRCSSNLPGTTAAPRSATSMAFSSSGVR